MKKFDKIMVTFHKTIEKLEDLAKTKAEEKQKILEDITDLRSKEKDIQAESDAALNVAAKMKEIFVPTTSL